MAAKQQEVRLHMQADLLFRCTHRGGAAFRTGGIQRAIPGPLRCEL